jgi:hypothetical protein
MTDLNKEVEQLYDSCLGESANYVSTKESCDPELLNTRIVELRALSIEFISADPKQPHGFDIYLETTMKYFRIGLRNLDEYTEAEKIAEQFFQTQKANSGHSIVTATYHWVLIISTTASKQYFADKYPASSRSFSPLHLDADRISTLRLARGEGEGIRTDVNEPRLSYLRKALGQLGFVIDSTTKAEVGGG